jgi:hypothetical protein
MIEETPQGQPSSNKKLEQEDGEGPDGSLFTKPSWARTYRALQGCCQY